HLVERLEGLGNEAVLELRNPLVVVAAQQVGPRVLVVAILVEDPPEDGDRRVVFPLVEELHGRGQLRDLLGGVAHALREDRVTGEGLRREVEVLQGVDVALLEQRLLGDRPQLRGLERRRGARRGRARGGGSGDRDRRRRGGSGRVLGAPARRGGALLG